MCTSWTEYFYVCIFMCAASDGGEEARPISSPLRVSPERSDQREESWASHGRVPVKQRLFLSKQKIGEYWLCVGDTETSTGCLYFCRGEEEKC